MALAVKDLIDAGVHFGHPASRWNPKMKPYIYGTRRRVHIIDLKETVRGLLRATKYLNRVAGSNGLVLFVGTKRQAAGTIVEEATRCGMPYVTERWLGGTLTNFRTIRARLGRLEELEGILDGEQALTFSKKMISTLSRERRKIQRNLGGIRHMTRLPEALFVIDPHREKIAVTEARKLGIKVVALLDTDCDPDLVDLPIPGNDDSMRSIELVVGRLAAAIAEGHLSAPPAVVAPLRPGRGRPAASDGRPSPAGPPPAPVVEVAGLRGLVEARSDDERLRRYRQVEAWLHAHDGGRRAVGLNMLARAAFPGAAPRPLHLSEPQLLALELLVRHRWPGASGLVLDCLAARPIDRAHGRLLRALVQLAQSGPEERARASSGLARLLDGLAANRPIAGPLGALFAQAMHALAIIDPGRVVATAAHHLPHVGPMELTAALDAVALAANALGPAAAGSEGVAEAGESLWERYMKAEAPAINRPGVLSRVFELLGLAGVAVEARLDALEESAPQAVYLLIERPLAFFDGPQKERCLQRARRVLEAHGQHTSLENLLWRVGHGQVFPPAPLQPVAAEEAPPAQAPAAQSATAH